jgi:uncharacterized tellurite resistance protein B-like protein
MRRTDGKPIFWLGLNRLIPHAKQFSPVLPWAHAADGTGKPVRFNDLQDCPGRAVVVRSRRFWTGDTMFDRLSAWLEEGRKDLSGGRDELQLAVAALLAEAARIDDKFDEPERETIRRLLQQRFGLSIGDARALAQAAERRAEGSAQIFGFVRTINENVAPEKRGELIEMLWEVAYADGVLDPLEDSLLRRIGGLIDVPDQERGAARLRVVRRLGIAEAE